MTGHWAWVLLAVIFAGGVAVGGLVVSLAGSRREDRAYDEGRADERADMQEEVMPDDPGWTPPRPVEQGPLETGARWEPEPTDRVYQWAHRNPIRATAPLTVIDWDALPWAEKEQLGLWDFGRRLEAEGWQIVAGDREPDEPDWSEPIELPEWAA